jgi:hypothetical protein
VAKQSGLGSNFFVGGYNLSNDTSALTSIRTPIAVQEITGIDVFAQERITLQRDGAIDWVTWFNPAAGQAHPVLSALPTTDVEASYFPGTGTAGPTVGNPAASIIAKQVNYDGSRSQAGEFPFTVQTVANGFGLEWGNALTAGVSTVTGAANGSSYDTGGSLAFGAQAYLHVFSFAGTDATVTVQDSANNSAFSNVTGLGFTAITAAPTSQRLATSATATIRQYLRVAVTTSAGFTSLGFAVNVAKNPISTLF